MSLGKAPREAAPDSPPTHPADNHSLLGTLPTIGLYLLIIWILNAQLVPGINESHYLPKAKHAWKPNFAPGDLFLASGNAHWLFAQLAGWMSTWASLAAVAWMGRIASWMLMAFAWQRCASSLRLPTMVAACVLAGWILATRLGNWAGEWAIGGFEAKSLAYPLVMLALSELIRKRWSRVWVWLGGAVAFHPLVGGWAGLTMFAAWLWFGRRESAWQEQLMPMVIAAVISMVGIVPAFSMIGGPARSGDVVIAQVHAFYRLAHHQTPHLFATSQHIRGMVSLTLLVIASGLIHYAERRKATVGGIHATDRCDYVQATRRLLAIAWLAVGLSGCGLVVDLVGVRTRPDLAASLLRFYWFRWSDIIVPLGWVAGFWCAALYLLQSSNPASKPQAEYTTQRRMLGLAALTILVLVTVGVMSDQVADQWGNEIAPADQTLLMSDSVQLASGVEVVRDWQDVCAWVRENTPEDALFLTPRAQQTFKWYAARAEVVTFKDVPQDSESLLEWYDRIGRCAPPRRAELQPLGWSTAQLHDLAERYKFQYVLVDRRIQREPPLLEIIYPMNTLQNGTYAIFKLSASGTH